MAMALAETLSRARPDSPTLLLDLDPQGSATGFAERTEGLFTRVRPIVARSAGRLSRLIRDASLGEEVVVIDTPPGHIDIADAAIGEADLVLIPTEPYLDPLTQALATVEMANGIAPTVIVLNMVNMSANDSSVAREGLIGADTKVLDAEIPNWVAIARIDGSQWTTDPKLLTVFSGFAENVLAEVV